MSAKGGKRGAMSPDVVKEVEVVLPAENYRPAVRKVTVNGQPMIAMSVGGMETGHAVTQATNNPLPRGGMPLGSRSSQRGED